MAEKNWNKETGTGSYSSSTTRANGKTASRQGTVSKTGEGSYTVKGTHTGANGRASEMNKNISKNPDGSTSAYSVYTGPNGTTTAVDNTIRKTQNGRSVTGTYETSGGKSGSFESDVNRSDGSVAKDQSLTNQNGRTWKRRINRTRDGNTVTRGVIGTNPKGQTRSYTESVTVDKP